VRLFNSVDEQVLGEKTAAAGETDECQRSNQRRPVGDGHVLPDAAHLANILLMVHRDDDRACGDEQQRLEETVCHKVENRGAVS